MPTKRVRQSERRRCVQACANCKRRKERCDGRQPCRRCVIRRVERDCAFASPPTAFDAPGGGSSSARTPDRLGSYPPLLPSHPSHPPSHPPSHSSHSSHPPHGSPAAHGHHAFNPYGPAAAAASSFHGNGSVPPSHHHHRRASSSQLSHLSQSTVVPQVSRLIADGKGRFMFIGDAANLAFVKVIRRLVRDRVGSCPFTDDPLRHIMVEATPEGRPRWAVTNPADVPAKPSPEQARYLLRWYLRASNCILDVFDEAELLEDLEHWLRGEPTTIQDEEAMDCLFYLAFAIGAQRCPDGDGDLDADAERYFNYGRFLAVSYAMENPTNNTVRSYVLVTVYLLGASRRNSAFMHLGVAVRAAYALGIHRRDGDIPARLFSAREKGTRERLWKALRVLDLFLSASLGRPLATSETRDTAPSSSSSSSSSGEAKGEGNGDGDGDGMHYSASLDLCAIFESILNDVYAKRMVSADALERISERHRRWASRFSDGLAADGMKPSRYVDAADGERYPNMGLYYLKKAYYWSIMLLSRPFLIDFVSRNIARSQASSTTWGDDTHTHTHTHTHTPQSSQPSPSSQLLVHACVDSAIRTVDLLSSLISDKNVAKRHPFVINSAFVSALVLGLAIFGDLDTTFPLDRGLDDARALLRKFSRHDPVASRELSIVEHLQGACVLYRERRARRKMECQGVLIGELFGTVHEGAPATTEMFRTGPGFFHRGAGGPGPGPGPSLGLGLVDHRHGGGSETGEVSSVDQTVSLTTGSTDGPSMMDGEAGRGPNAPPMDMFLPMSPRTLLFDSYGQDMPFFPTIDASLTHLGYADDVMLSDTGVLPEPAC